MFFKLEKKYWAFAFTYLSMFVLGISDNIRGPLFSDLITFFHLSNSEASFSFALASTAALLANMSSVLLFKKFNLSQVLATSLFIMAAGTLIMGWSPGFSSYLIGAALFGASMGFLGVTQTLMIAESVEPANQSRALSGLHGIYGLSSLLAPLVAALSPLAIGNWRAGFYVVAAITFIFALASVVARPNPEYIVHQIPTETTDQKSTWASLIVVGGIFAFYVVAEILVSSRLALYMRTYFAMDLESSSQYVTYFFVFLLAGRLLFALKSFKTSLKHQLNLSLMLSILFLILGLKLHPFFLVMLGFSMAPFYPLSIIYISEQAGLRKKRQYITFALSFQSLCVISMHMGVGYLTDQFGLFYAFGVGIISLLLALVCVNFHPKFYSA